MLARRVIPCLDVHGGQVTRGVQFGKAEAGELRNVGDPVDAMSAALTTLEDHPHCRVAGVSRLYRTPPWGKTDQACFFNAAARVETALGAVPLLGLALGIEQANKRLRIERWGPRTLDLDLIDYHGLVRRKKTLSIRPLVLPHPGISERLFVLEPLVEVAPAWRNPLTKESAAFTIRKLRRLSGT